MPAEVARLGWTPARRDWWFIGVIATAAVAVVLGILAAGIGASHGTDAARGCVRYERAGFTGAQQELRCGSAATRLCRATPIPHGLADQCAAIARARRGAG
jgi:hypothetical protein